MKAYKLELIIIDTEDDGIDGIFNNLFVPHITLNCEKKDIGEWSDDHPLNKIDGFNNAVKKYFPNKEQKFIDNTIMALYHASGGDFSDYCEDSDFGNELLEWLVEQRKRIKTRKKTL